MGEIRTPALVLRTFDHGESDRMVHLYSEALGRVTAIAKGARRSRRRFPGTLETFTIVLARLVDPPRSSLLRLDGARLIQPFERFVHPLGRYAIACQFLELLDRFTGERQANPELFRFAMGALDVVAVEPPDRLLALLLFTKTLARLGYRPQLLSCACCGAQLGGLRLVGFEPRHGGSVCTDCCAEGDRRVPVRLLMALETGIRSPLSERRRLGLAAVDVRRTEILLDRFFRFHVGLELRSTAFVRQALPVEALDGVEVTRDTAPAASMEPPHSLDSVGQ